LQGPPREEYQVSHLFADNFKHDLFGLASGSKSAAADVQVGIDTNPRAQ